LGHDTLNDRDSDVALAQRIPAKDDQGRKVETEALVVSQVYRKRVVEMVLEMNTGTGGMCRGGDRGASDVSGLVTIIPV